MRSSGLWTLLALFSFNLVACSTTSSRKIALVDIVSYNSKIRVFTKEEPTFNYKVICEAKIHTHGIEGAAKTLDGYRKEAAKVAQDCDADMAIVKSVTGLGDDLTVQIVGIQQTSEDAKLFTKVRENPGFLGGLTQAALNGEGTKIKKTLKQIGVSPERTKRADYDNRIIDSIITMVAKQGAHCSGLSMKLLGEEYQAIIGDYDDKSPNSWSTQHEMRQLMSCPGTPLKSSFANSKRKNKFIEAIYSTIDTALSHGWKNQDAKQNYLTFSRVYPELEKTIQQACGKDKKSSLCRLSKPLEKTYEKVRKTI